MRSGRARGLVQDWGAQEGKNLFGESAMKRGGTRREVGRDRPWLGWLLAAVILGGIAVLVYRSGLRRPVAPEDGVSVAGAGTGSEVSVERAEGSGPGVVRGRWVRPDGGYVLEIVEVGAAGAARMGYYNPRAIHVSRAETSEDTDGRIKVFVELQDEGYPGCNYQLTYDPTNDVLLGSYYQAALHESFEVVFTRVR